MSGQEIARSTQSFALERAGREKFGRFTIDGVHKNEILVNPIRTLETFRGRRAAGSVRRRGRITVSPTAMSFANSGPVSIDRSFLSNCNSGSAVIEAKDVEFRDSIQN